MLPFLSRVHGFCAGAAWPHVRAGLVLLHVIAVVVLAFPHPGSLLQPAGWRSANAQTELARWAERLHTRPDVLRRRALAAAERYRDVHARVAWPFERYAEAVGTRQPWQMFAIPQRVPAELHLDIETEGRFRGLVRPDDPRSDWRARERKHNRFRKLLGRFGRGFRSEHYHGVADWMAHRAARDFPEVTRVRVRLYRYRALSPERVRDGDHPEGRYEHEILYDAEALR